jgi:hypothetical protein
MRRCRPTLARLLLFLLLRTQTVSLSRRVAERRGVSKGTVDQPIALRLCPPIPGACSSSGIPIRKAYRMSLLPPLPILPAEMTTITDREPVFRLNGRFGATRYRIELSRSPEFEDSSMVDTGFRVSDGDEIAPTVEIPWHGEPLEDGAWYWRAFCAGEDGVWTPPANCRIFSVSAEDRDRIQAPERIDHPYLILGDDEIPELKKKAVAMSPGLRRMCSRTDCAGRGIRTIHAGPARPLQHGSHLVQSQPRKDRLRVLDDG